MEAFLVSLNLGKYFDAFLEHGFDCLDTVRDMEESDMRDVGMLRGRIISRRGRRAV